MERLKLNRKPSPHLLPTESPVELERDQRGIRETLKPKNPIAEIYADDLAFDNWSAKRHRRAMSQVVKKHIPQSLCDTLSELDILERGEKRSIWWIVIAAAIRTQRGRSI